MSDLANRRQILGVDFAMDRITVSFVDTTKDHPAVTEVTQLQIDPAACEAEALELLDAIDSFVDAGLLVRRNPPESIAGRTRR